MHLYTTVPRPPRWNQVVSFGWRVLPARARRWLLAPDSTSALIEKACGEVPTIHIVQQGWRYAHPSESMTLNLRPRQYSWIREVKIVARGQHWMLARTVFPRSTLDHCPHPHITSNIPLGSILFGDRSVRRSHFEVAQLYGNHPPLSPTLAWNDVVWGRRSIFFIKSGPLLLSEVFLPAFQRYLES